ncbi:MAG TPA: GNAT family N-acetyltransferase [Puia sp.]|nr:GNAT family N-acetyltransferase [Puia sp.]
MTIQHTHTEKGGSFYVGDLSSPTAQLVYRMAGEHKMIIDHTEVDEIHKGEGIGRQLVVAAVDYARQQGAKIQPLCSFARSILKHSKEYEDIYIPPNQA